MPSAWQRMRERLQAAFAPDLLEVIDDSHKHVGHAGARDGRGHFSVEIRSDAFAGLTSLARHRGGLRGIGRHDDDGHPRAVDPRQRGLGRGRASQVAVGQTNAAVQHSRRPKTGPNRRGSTSRTRQITIALHLLMKTFTVEPTQPQSTGMRWATRSPSRTLHAGRTSRSRPSLAR